MKNSLLIVGVAVLVVYLYFQSQSTRRGLATGKAAVRRPGTSQSGLSGLLNSLFGKKPTASSGGGKGSGGGSGSGSGAGTAGGARMCSKTPGTAFCGCASCLAYAGKDSNGNEIYQRVDGSLIYSDGSPATQADIACNEGACAGTVCNPPLCNPQCVSTNQPCTSHCACAGCAGSGCFCAGCTGGGLAGGCAVFASCL